MDKLRIPAEREIILKSQFCSCTVAKINIHREGFHSRCHQAGKKKISHPEHRTWNYQVWGEEKEWRKVKRE